MRNKNITFMAQLTVNIQVKVSVNEAIFLDKISSIYHYKRCKFIRDAIREKMERDVPKMRLKRFKEMEVIDCPF